MLSALRILCALPLIWLPSNDKIFVVFYLFCGITDVLDGHLARKLNAFSDFGAKLDSLGDCVFWVIVLYRFFTNIKTQELPLLIGSIAVVFVLRLINLLITKIKFKQWGMLHTIGNKISGGILFFAIPVAFLLNDIPFWLGIVSVAPSLCSALEEMLILIISKEYSPNRKNLFLI